MGKDCSLRMRLDMLHWYLRKRTKNDRDTLLLHARLSVSWQTSVPSCQQLHRKLLACMVSSGFIISILRKSQIVLDPSHGQAGRSYHGLREYSLRGESRKALHGGCEPDHELLLLELE